MLTEHPGYDGEIYLDTAKEAVKCNVKIENTRYLTVSGIGRQGISIYAFNKLMLSNYVESVLPKEENYFFSGPNLGLYHDTQDPREGPYVNHGIENLTGVAPDVYRVMSELNRLIFPSAILNRRL